MAGVRFLAAGGGRARRTVNWRLWLIRRERKARYLSLPVVSPWIQARQGF